MDRFFAIRTARAGRFLAAITVFFLLMSLLIPAGLADGAGDVTLTVSQCCTNTGTSAPPSETCVYKLTPQQPDNPMPAGADASGYYFTITGTDDADIGPIHFTHAGEYSYEISHTTAPASGYTYDREVYTLEILVERDLTTSVLAYKVDGSKAAVMRYEHAYNFDGGLIPSDPGLMADPPIVKTVSGDPAKASPFTFRLVPGKSSNPMPTGSVNGVKNATITGSGQAEFGTWSYTAEGTYYYTVSEVNSGLSGYTYDATVYTITDSVKAVDGQLMVTRVVTNNANKQVGALAFINKYASSAGGGDGPKTGDDSDVMLYTILFCAAGAAALYSLSYLLLAGKRRRKAKG